MTDIGGTKIGGCFPQKVTWDKARVGDLLCINPIHGGAMTGVLVEKGEGGGWMQQLSLVSPDGEILDGAALVSTAIRDSATIHLLGTVEGLAPHAHLHVDSLAI